MSEIKLIVGLGNPGRKYENTRHNLGFITVDSLVKSWKSKWKNWLGRAYISYPFNNKLAILKPRTFMNNSGFVVNNFLEINNLLPNNMLVISDDFSLPLGKLRLRLSGSAGGHNGLSSIIENIGVTEFSRLRLGMGPVPTGYDPSDFVLSEFNKEEEKEVELMVEKAADIVKAAFEQGVEKAASKIS